MLNLLLTGLAGALWYVHPALGPWPLVLVAAGRLARLATSRGAWGSGVRLRRTPFDAPMLLFLLSAALGAAIAYDRPASAEKFWMILGGLALYDSVALAPEQVRLRHRRLAPLPIIFGVLPSLLALYFLLTTDWNQWVGKLAALDPAMRWLASWQLKLPGHRLHPNVAGGLLAALLPIQVGAWWCATWGARRIWGACFVGVTLVGLIFSASRGAWVALLVASLLALGIHFATRQWWKRRGPKWPAAQPGSMTRSGYDLPAFSLLVGLLLFAGVAAAVVAPVSGRLALLRNSVDLALDYPFTGLGLNGFDMAYSSYVLLLHVGHTVHSHNLFLNLWLEQGLAGLLAFGWLLLQALSLGIASMQRAARTGRTEIEGDDQAWPAYTQLALRYMPALAALGVIVVHGQVDDAFYGSRAVLWLFLPCALLARPWIWYSDAGIKVTALDPRAWSSSRWLVPAALFVLLALLAPVRAAFQENLGAIAQTRAELSVYRWPGWPIQDALRRSGGIDLAPAVTRYQAALALNPRNAAGNRRLGQIELSLGQYQAAGQHLTAAYQVAPEQRATRQLLGEYYAVSGDVQAAAALWQTIDMSEGQANLRLFWYQFINDRTAADRIQQVASLAQN